MELKSGLIEAVGAEYVLDSPDALTSYSNDFSLTPPAYPDYVVRPGSTGDVQKVINLANKYKTPVIPLSSGVHFYGSTIPKKKGIIVDLRRMNRIIEIDEVNRKVRVEPGVTWGKLQPELQQRGWMVATPLLPHSSRSVISDCLEREVPLIPKYEYAEPLLSMEVVWPNGDIFRTGSASSIGYPKNYAEGANPQGPGSLDFFRFLQGAQGTMGVVTWANIKFESLPQLDKTFFIPFDRLEQAIEPLYRIQRKKIGNECLLVNNVNLATILSALCPENFYRLRQTLPSWTLILVLSGLRRRPEEKIDYEEKALREIINEFPDFSLSSMLSGILELERDLPKTLRNPWPSTETYWKHRNQGRCQDIFFIIRPQDAPTLVAAIDDVVGKYGYPVDDIGCYLQPIEYGRACHLEFNFYYRPESQRDVATIMQLYSEAVGILIDKGALFTRPYGMLSELVYSQAPAYTSALKRLKNIFDPNHIMCPGNLCF